MTDQNYSVEALTRQLIEQCRAEIHAAMLQIEAGREILKRTLPLLERWRRSAHEHGIKLPAFDFAKAGMFVLVEPAPRRRHPREDMRAAVNQALANRRSRRRSASG